jgi:hypothetical protein
MQRAIRLHKAEEAGTETATTVPGAEAPAEPTR